MKAVYYVTRYLFICNPSLNLTVGIFVYQYNNITIILCMSLVTISFINRHLRLFYIQFHKLCYTHVYNYKA